MKRRSLIAKSAAVVSVWLAGCGSGEISEAGTSGGSAENEPSGESSEKESSNNDGPAGPESAVESYNDAVSLLKQNANRFNQVRQELITGSNTDFNPTEINSRITEANSQLEKAKNSDDGSLSDEIEALRAVATYQESVVEYNRKYLKMKNSIDTGLSEYNNGRHESAVEVFDNVQNQIEPTKISLKEVSKRLETAKSAVEQSDIRDSTTQNMNLLRDQNMEAQIEITILEDLIPARIDEIKGDLHFKQGYDDFDNREYDSARSHFSDAENRFVAGTTKLERIDVEQVTTYIESLIEDTEELVCEYEHSKVAANQLQKSVNAAQNGDSAEAEMHFDDADSSLSKIDTCRA